MEDRLEEAIHVLRSHAVGQAPGIPGAHADMHGLLGAVSTSSGSMGGLPQAYSNPGLPLSNRHPTMVSVDTYVCMNRWITWNCIQGIIFLSFFLVF